MGQALNQFDADIILSIQKNFPDVAVQTATQTKSFIEDVVPPLVLNYLIKSGSLKNCGSISQAFADIAAQNGFPVVVLQLPGHFVDLVMTKSGDFILDLSNIQFRLIGFEGDPEYRTSRTELINEIIDDPFKAISVTKVNSLDYADSVYYVPNDKSKLDQFSELKKSQRMGYHPEFDRFDWSKYGRRSDPGRIMNIFGGQ